MESTTKKELTTKKESIHDSDLKDTSGNTSPNDLTKPLYFNKDYLLEESDEQLVNVEKIEEKVQEYIHHYKSEDFSNYMKLLIKLPKLFGKKNFIIDYSKETINIYRVTKGKGKDKDKDNELLHKIIKPVIEDLPTFNELKLNLNYLRNTLKTQFIDYVSQDNVSVTDKSKFVKQKENFIKELEKYYIYQNYYSTINKQSNNMGGKYISVGNYRTFINDKNEYDNKLFFSHYKINSDIIEHINQNKIEKLDQYHLIKEQIELENQKELEESIEKYLSNDGKNIMKKIQKQQDNDVDYIVAKLPKLDPKLLNYL